MSEKHLYYLLFSIDGDDVIVGEIHQHKISGVEIYKPLVTRQLLCSAIERYFEEDGVYKDQKELLKDFLLKELGL